MSPAGKSSKAAQLSYHELSHELDGLMAQLEQGELDIDKAVHCYERGLEIVKQLEAYLVKAENRVSQLHTSLKIDGEA